MQDTDRRGLASAAGILLLLAATTAVAVPSTTVAVDGAVATPRTYDLAGLMAFPPSTRTLSYTAAGQPVTDTYTGASLWDVVNASAIDVDPGIKNDVLNKVVVATGSDGYKVAYSLGELNPNFGNRGDLVAYADTAGQIAGGAGFARITANGDAAGGRYVSNLTTLTVENSAAQRVGGNGGVSSSFTVSGDVVAAKTFDLAGLETLTQRTETVGSVTYTGVSFWNLLNAVGIATDPTIKNDILRDYVVATGSDGYQVAFSLGELDPLFGGDPADLIAFSASDGSLMSTGFARIVVPGDGRAGRFVSNLVSLQVFDATAAVPEPATWTLLAGGLACFELTRHRRRSRHRAMTSST